MESISLFIPRLSFLLILVLSNGVLSYAPGDTGGYCLSNSALPDYPQTVKRLMDSWSYGQLLGAGGVWSTIDADNDNKTWVPVPLETCRERVSISEPQNLPQDNWLITQYINKSIPSQFNNEPVTIFINISYILDSSCANVNCIPNFQLLYHLSNDSDSSLASHRPGYSLISNVSSVDDLTLHMKTFSFNLSPEDTGFYIAVRDIGANITITRLFVYRLIGPAMQSGLTLFPETPAPTTDCINITGLCVANANTSTGSLPVLSLNINGSWSYDDMCMCIPGHELMLIEGTHQCQACTTSKYKSTLSNTACTSCPLNSESTVHGSSVCQCDTGHYRAPNEGPSIQCTGPPSAPVGISVNITASTYSLISWGPPDSTGGRNDVYYDVYYRRPVNATAVKANPHPLYSTSYNVTGLSPQTTYVVIVYAENGVSNQSSSTQRSIFIVITTTEGVPLPVVGVKVLSGGQYVEWNVSSSAHGTIIRYEVVFYADLSNPSQRGRYISAPSDVTVYQVNITRDFPSDGQPVYVSVRSYTQAGSGDWSEPIVFSHSNPLAPTSISNVVSSTQTSASTTTTTTTNTIITITASVTTTTTTSGLATTRVSTSIPGTTEQSTTTPTATPTESGTNPVISIVAVLGGALGILLIVTLGAVGYFIFRKLRIKYTAREETDHDAPLVKYEVVPGEEEENRVQINPLAEDS